MRFPVEMYFELWLSNGQQVTLFREKPPIVPSPEPSHSQRKPNGSQVVVTVCLSVEFERTQKDDRTSAIAQFWFSYEISIPLLFQTLFSIRSITASPINDAMLHVKTEWHCLPGCGDIIPPVAVDITSTSWSGRSGEKH
jgi:hypothetical protein